jgi:hypothetical protein
MGEEHDSRGIGWRLQTTLEHHPINRDLDVGGLAG